MWIMLHCLLTSLARAWGDLNFFRALIVTVIIMISGPEGLWIACFINILCSFKVFQMRDVCSLAWWLIHLVKLLDLCHACHRSYQKFGMTGWCYPSKIWDSSFIWHWVYTNGKNFLNYNLRKQSETITVVVLLQYTPEVSVQTLVHQLPSTSSSKTGPFQAAHCMGIVAKHITSFHSWMQSWTLMCDFATELGPVCSHSGYLWQWLLITMTIWKTAGCVTTLYWFTCSGSLKFELFG